MTENQKNKKYDLEERSYEFARKVRAFLNKIPKTIQNIEDGKQLIRSSGSVGANYIEANDSLGKKDFLMRIKISRKEAKESRFWLRLLNVNGNLEVEKEQKDLIQEAKELMNIFASIMRKFE